MCLTCGCDAEATARVSTPGVAEPPHSHHPEEPQAGLLEHDHPHPHPHPHPQPHSHPRTVNPASEETETITIGERILAKNDHLAAHTRGWLRDRGIVAVNLMSSPGSGKTSLLERTIAEFAGREMCVIEGDQETAFDAERIRAAGARAVQVNTGSGCHLDAPMVQTAIEILEPGDGSVLFIENVGNLVCPALFDVGADASVVVISVTEGDDKPLKYPHMFAAADLVVVNKTDLLPYVDFDLRRFADQARSIRPGVQIIALSVRDGTSLDLWYSWLHRL